MSADGPTGGPTGALGGLRCCDVHLASTWRTTGAVPLRLRRGDAYAYVRCHIRELPDCAVDVLIYIF